MTPRDIIAEAWAITTREKSLRRWGFTAALFETLRNVELFLYQAYYLYWYMKGVSVGWVSVEAALFHSLPVWLFIVITVLLVVLLVLELFVPTLATGAVIGLAAKAHQKEEVKGGLILALYNFFPILVVHEFFILSSFVTVFTVWSFLLRYGGDPSLKIWTMTLLVILWLFSAVFHFFASFSEEGVVIQKYGVFTAISRSFKLILSYLHHVMFLLILLLVISLRIFINAAMIFLLPGIAIGVGFLLTFILPIFVSIIVGSILGLVLLLLFSYFMAYLHIFKQTVWTLTFLEFNKEKDLDVIL